MTDQSKFGIHEHGEQQVKVDLTSPAVRDVVKKIVNDHLTASAYLQLVLLSFHNRRTTMLPCKKCLLDTALQFKDIGSLIEELANGK